MSAGLFVPRVQQLIAQHAPALAAILAPLGAIYQQAQQAAKVWEQMVKRHAQQDPVCERLMQVPGVGHLVASTYVATLDDPTRFPKATQVAAYLGLVPRV